MDRHVCSLLDSSIIVTVLDSPDLFIRNPELNFKAFGENDVQDLVRLRDGYAWLYLDGRRTMLFCVLEDPVRCMEPSFEERLDLEISGPSLMKMLARDAVELSAVSHGMDGDMEPGYDVTYDRVESLTPEGPRERYP